MEALERELKEYNKETEKFSSEVSDAFGALAHKDIVKTFTDLMLMMFTRFGKQDIIIERCESGKEKVAAFPLGDRAKDRRRQRRIQLSVVGTAQAAVADGLDDAGRHHQHRR